MLNKIANKVSRTTPASLLSSRSLARGATAFVVAASLAVGVGGVGVPQASALAPGGSVHRSVRLNSTTCLVQQQSNYTGTGGELVTLQTAFRGNNNGVGRISSIIQGNTLMVWANFTNYVPAGQPCDPEAVVAAPESSTNAFRRLPEWAKPIVGEILYTTVYLAAAYAIDGTAYGILHEKTLASGKNAWEVYGSAVGAFSGAVGGGIGIWINNYVDGVSTTASQITGFVTGAITGGLVNYVFHEVPPGRFYYAIRGTAQRIIRRWNPLGINVNPNLSRGMNAAGADVANVIAHHP